MTLYDILVKRERFYAYDGELEIYIDADDYANDDYYHEKLETELAEMILRDIPAEDGERVKCEFKDYFRRHDRMFREAMKYTGVEDTPTNRLYLLLGMINGAADDEVYHIEETEYAAVA